MGRWSARSWSLRRRIVALTAGTTLLAVVLLTVVLQVVLDRLARTDADRVATDRASSVSSSIRVDTDGGLIVPRSQLAAGVAVYASGGTLVAGSPPASLADAYSRLRLTDVQRTASLADDSPIVARPFRRSGVGGVVIASEPFAPYEEAERLALVVSLITGLVTVAAAAAVAAWATGRALRPVEAMARSAAEWSEHDLGRRFGADGARTPAPTDQPGRPDAQADELGQLAVTLDSLLDRVTAAIRSEQRLTSELAHELRTPLTSVRGEAELALLRDEVPAATRHALESIVAAAGRMAQTIATLLDLARSEGTVLERSRADLTAVVAEARTGALGGVEGAPVVVVDVPGVQLGVPHALAVRACAPILENAVRFAEARVAVTARHDGGFVDVVVEDDGPGLASESSADVFEPGVTTGSSAGLGLAIARRIARSGGGDVTVDPGSRPGASRFVIRLPSGG